MFRRLFWMMVGASGALWVRSKVIRTVEKYIPARVVKAAERKAKSFGRELLDAQKAAKSAMREREDELRSGSS